MKKIIPLKKELTFKTNIGEVTSISLEHELNINNNDITGEFIISGEYKVSDNSKTVTPFVFNLPFEIMIDENYDTSSAIVDIDDFYYEIIDDCILSVSIDVVVDKLKEVLIPDELVNIDEKKDIIEELYEDENNNLKEDRCIEEDDIIPGKEIKNMEEKQKEEVKNNKEDITDKEEVKEKINSIFSNVDDNSCYVTYNVYIIREGDTVESIIEKYETNEDELKKYNNLSDLKLGDKIIIPAK